ncbi:MAG: LD-carboxypeptidase [Alphaproteobacteria bacterium]
MKKNYNPYGWQKLNTGDIVEVIAPGSAHNFYSDEINKVKDFLEKLKLIPRIPGNIIASQEELKAKKYDIFCANTDEIRLEHLKNALYSEDSKIIWCIRGGYGCTRLIEELDKLSPPPFPKLLIGFSDITVLHLFLQNKWGWPSIHGKCLKQFINDYYDSASEKELVSLIFGERNQVAYDHFTPLNNAAKTSQTIRGKITGGNLCLIQNSIGTVWQLDAKNKIVLLEDVNEYAYRVDRTLEHLYQTKILKDSKAIIIGDFTPTAEENKEMIDMAINRFANKMTIPVIHGAGFGHGKINHPLPFGTESTLLFNERIKLTCDSGMI